MRIEEGNISKAYTLSGQMALSLKCPELHNDERNPGNRMASDVVEDYLCMSDMNEGGLLQDDGAVKISKVSLGVIDWHSMGDEYVELQLSFDFICTKQVRIIDELEPGIIKETSDSIYEEMKSMCVGFALHAEETILEQTPVVVVNRCDITYDDVT